MNKQNSINSVLNGKNKGGREREKKSKGFLLFITEEENKALQKQRTNTEQIPAEKCSRCVNTDKLAKLKKKNIF